MGMFDYIFGTVTCPYCKEKTRVEDQIKWLDDRSLTTYKVGDEIDIDYDGVYGWGSYVRPHLHSPCEKCGRDVKFEAIIKDKVITDIRSKIMMTSYEFEVAAKNAVIDVMRDQFNIEIPFDTLDFVWFAHELGYKKCTLFSYHMNGYYAEVTFNRDRNEVYVDIYEKKHKETIHVDDLNFSNIV